MKVNVQGHNYSLANFENKEVEGQKLQFIQKEPVSEGSPEMKTIADGTTNEEVLEVILDRLNYLNSKFPCRENALAITNIQQGLMWLNLRTSNRVKRNVEGKHLA